MTMHSIVVIACHAPSIKQAVDSDGAVCPATASLGDLAVCFDWVDNETCMSCLSDLFDESKAAIYDTWLRVAKEMVQKAMQSVVDHHQTERTTALELLIKGLDLFDVEASAAQATKVKDCAHMLNKKQAEAVRALKKMGIEPSEEAIYADITAQLERSDGKNVAWGLHQLVIRTNIYDKEKGVADRGKIRQIYDRYLRDLFFFLPRSGFYIHYI